MTFKNGVLAARDANVRAAFRVGKGALSGNHAAKIHCNDAKRISGSIELDAALAQEPKHAQSNRWDYGLGYRLPGGKEVAIWIEVHSATTGEVGTVLRKLDWLKAFLPERCEVLWGLTRAAAGKTDAFVWVASGAVHINKNSPQARRLRIAGLPWPRSGLTLP